jgi:hypothetical protein
MKDGRTHLATHKAEHAVDLETGAIVGVTVQDADDGDTTTCIETLIEAAEQMENFGRGRRPLRIEKPPLKRRSSSSWVEVLPRRVGSGL